MKVDRIFVALLFLFGAGILGCSNTEPESEITATEVKDEAAEAAKVAGEYLNQQGQGVIAGLETELAQVEEQAEAMKAKAEKLQGSARTAAEEDIAELEEKSEEIRNKLEELKANTGAASSEMEQGVKSAMDELRKASEEAASHFE